MFAIQVINMEKLESLNKNPESGMGLSLNFESDQAGFFSIITRAFSQISTMIFFN
jgi:hypothetical protein